MPGVWVPISCFISNFCKNLFFFVLLIIESRLNCTCLVGQVIDTVEKRTIYSTVKTLLKEDGPKGLYRGLGPRFLSISAWGTCMIVSYEFLSE